MAFNLNHELWHVTSYSIVLILLIFAQWENLISLQLVIDIFIAAALDLTKHMVPSWLGHCPVVRMHINRKK